MTSILGKQDYETDAEYGQRLLNYIAELQFEIGNLEARIANLEVREDEIMVDGYLMESINTNSKSGKTTYIQWNPTNPIETRLKQAEETIKLLVEFIYTNSKK